MEGKESHLLQAIMNAYKLGQEDTAAHHVKKVKGSTPRHDVHTL